MHDPFNIIKLKKTEGFTQGMQVALRLYNHFSNNNQDQPHTHK